MLEAADLSRTNRQFYNTSLSFPWATIIPPFIMPTTCTTQPSSTNRWQAFQARRSPVAWGEALVHCILESYTFCAAHPTPSFIPPPLNPYNRLLADVLMERDEDMEKAEMEDRETKDRGVESKLYGGGGATRGDGTTRRGKQEGGMMRGEVTTSQHIERQWRWQNDTTTSRGKQEACASRGDLDNKPAP